MTYKILVEDRKEVVRKLEELTGERAEYTRVPRMAYIVGGVAVEKNSTVTLAEDARMDLVEALIAEGLIEEEAPAAIEETQETAEDATEDTAADQSEEGEDEALPNDQMENATAEYDALVEEQPEEQRIVRPSISFPLSAHRAESIVNLVCTLFTRGKLLSKATGGVFFATPELVDHIQESSGYRTVDQAVKDIQEAGGMRGISFEDGKVVFDGFPATNDPATIKAWTELCAAINRNAIKQLHVRAKEVNDENEKFTFRTWLTRLGMNGPELRAERNILYRNLSGHTAFRTSKDEEKWKARQAAKRAELKAMKEESGAED